MFPLRANSSRFSGELGAQEVTGHLPEHPSFPLPGLNHLTWSPKSKCLSPFRAPSRLMEKESGTEGREMVENTGFLCFPTGSGPESVFFSLPFRSIFHLSNNSYLSANSSRPSASCEITELHRFCTTHLKGLT